MQAAFLPFVEKGKNVLRLFKKATRNKNARTKRRASHRLREIHFSSGEVRDSGGIRLPDAGGLR